MIEKDGGMEMNTFVIGMMLFVCLALLALIALAKPLKMLLRFLFSAAAGGCLLWIGQCLGASVGANPATLLLSGLLGLPGVAGIFILGLFL